MALVKTCTVISLLGLVLLCNIHTAESISCYECNTYNVSKCATDPPESLKRNCSEYEARDGKAYPICRKTLLTMDYGLEKKPGEQRITRTCAWEDSSYKNACYKRSGSGWRQVVCSCSDDFCNTAPSISLATTAITIIAFSVFHLVLFWLLCPFFHCNVPCSRSETWSDIHSSS